MILFALILTGIQFATDPFSSYEYATTTQKPSLVPFVVVSNDPECGCPSGVCWGTNESCVAPFLVTQYTLTWIPGYDTQSTNTPSYEVVLSSSNPTAPLSQWTVEGYVTNNPSFVVTVDFTQNKYFSVKDVYNTTP